MKKLLLSACFLVTTISNAQANYKAQLTEFVAENNIFDVPNRNAEELYQLTKSWIIVNYPIPDKVIIFDDANKALKIKYFFDIDTEVKKPSRLKVKYMTLFDFKDGKVRVTFTDVAKTYQTKYEKFFNKEGKPKTDKYSQEALSILEQHVSKFVDDYLEYLKKGDTW